jgi:hypothetical protein
MDVLVLYYSFSGHTRSVAEALATELGADLREIECPTYRRWYGPLAMVWDVVTGHQPPILPLGSPGSYYDLIVVGGPVWMAKAAPPVMRVLDGSGRHFKRAGLFVTCGGGRASRPDDAIAEMSRSLGTRAVATRIFRAADVHAGSIAGEIENLRVQLQGLRTGGGATRADPDNPGWAPIHWPSVRGSTPSDIGLATPPDKAYRFQQPNDRVAPVAVKQPD